MQIRDSPRVCKRLSRNKKVHNVEVDFTNLIIVISHKILYIGLFTKSISMPQFSILLCSPIPYTFCCCWKNYILNEYIYLDLGERIE